MIAVIHQPNLFPRIKVLQKLMLADIWIVLDDVQYCQREYQNRTLIVLLKNEPHWLTIPVHLPNGQKTLIKDVAFDKDFTINQIKKTISLDLRGNSENAILKNDIIDILDASDENFVDFVVGSACALMQYGRKLPEIIKSSSIPGCSGKKSEKLVSLCKYVNADTYLCDSGGSHYLDERVFEENGIRVLWQVWDAPSSNSAIKIKQYLRNGSGLNLLARSKDEFVDCISTNSISKIREYAEGK